jgi:hypothetical protein
MAIKHPSAVLPLARHRYTLHQKYRFVPGRRANPVYRPVGCYLMTTLLNNLKI